ncbi:hypothetical protein TRAPUB_1712, partial [Trametes pubescens]
MEDHDSGNGGDDPVVPFEGDYYGAYSGDDFDYFDEYIDPNDGRENRSEDSDSEERRRDRMEDEEDNDNDAANLEAENGWKPPPAHPPPPGEAPGAPTAVDHAQEPPENDMPARHIPDRAQQSRAHEHLHTKTFKVPFPGNRAGAPTDQRRERSAYETYQARIDAVNENPYAPFISRMDWEFARWAKNRGPGSTAVSELLQIEG